MTTPSEPLFVRQLSRKAEKRTQWKVPESSYLYGKAVRLEKLDMTSHPGRLWQTLQLEPKGFDIWDYLPYGPFKDLESFCRYLEPLSKAPDIRAYVINRVDVGDCVGVATFLEIYPEHGGIEIGHIWFSAALRQNAAGTDALFAMMRHAMDDLGYRRLVWKCNAMNEKSRQMARRLGFRLEGVFHNHMLVKGHNRDTAWYSITEDEWPECRDLIKTWVEKAAWGDKPDFSLSEAMAKRNDKDKQS